MNITDIFSFLVHPAKGLEEQPAIGGTRVPLNGNLFQMLSSLFSRSDNECNIEISFNPNEDGEQQNDCRDEILILLKEPSMKHARALASRLQSVTTNRSGLGLLFLTLGQKESLNKVYISRFPADFGILAEEDQRSLRVEFLEKVFMRNAFAYKAAMFHGSSFDSDFWIGKAVDKQINNKIITISSYWIREFLLSDFRTTPAGGTRRLAIALREAMDSSTILSVKEEIAASARLSENLNGQTISINDFADRFGFSQETRDAVSEKLKHPSLTFDQFEFSLTEFQKHLPYRSIELSNGAILTATVGNFDECFERREVTDVPEEYEFRTFGRIVNERLRKTK